MRWRENRSRSRGAEERERVCLPFQALTSPSHAETANRFSRELTFFNMNSTKLNDPSENAIAYVCTYIKQLRIYGEVFFLCRSLAHPCTRNFVILIVYVFRFAFILLNISAFFAIIIAFSFIHSFVRAQAAHPRDTHTHSWSYTFWLHRISYRL